MIKIDVKDYCHNCGSFVADVEGPALGMYCDEFGRRSHVYLSDIIIRCAKRGQCEVICRYLEDKNNGNQER